MKERLARVRKERRHEPSGHSPHGAKDVQWEDRNGHKKVSDHVAHDLSPLVDNTSRDGDVRSTNTTQRCFR